MLRASLRGNIQMRIDIANDAWPIEANLAELEIALLNVAVNARDAMPQGGIFAIDVRNMKPSAHDGTLDVRSVLHHEGTWRRDRPRAQRIMPPDC